MQGRTKAEGPSLFLTCIYSRPNMVVQKLSCGVGENGFTSYFFHFLAVRREQITCFTLIFLKEKLQIKITSLS